MTAGLAQKWAAMVAAGLEQHGEPAFEPWMFEALQHWIPDDWQIERLRNENKAHVLLPLMAERRKLVEKRLATELTARAWVKADRAIGAR